MKTGTAIPKEVEVLESKLAELGQTESSTEQLEAEVDKVRSKKLREVQPELKPLDRKARTLKHEAIEIVKANRNNKALFGKGKKSIHTRAGTAGFSKGRPSVKIPRGVEDKDLVAKCVELGIDHICVQKIERFHRTKFRQAVRDKLITKEQAKLLGVKIVQREHYYVRTKTAKRARPASAKARSRKAVAA